MGVRPPRRARRRERARTRGRRDALVRNRARRARLGSRSGVARRGSQGAAGDRARHGVRTRVRRGARGLRRRVRVARAPVAALGRAPRAAGRAVAAPAGRRRGAPVRGARRARRVVRDAGPGRRARDVRVVERRARRRPRAPRLPGAHVGCRRVGRGARPRATEPGREHRPRRRRGVQACARRQAVALPGALAGRAPRLRARPHAGRRAAPAAPRARARSRRVRLAVLGNAAVLHTRRWAEHFRGRGHDVGVWSLEAPPPGFAAHALPAAPVPGFLRYPLALPALRRDLARFAPDLVDAHYVPNYGVLGALSGRRPLVVTAWGSDLLTTGRRDPLQRARARYVLSRADAVLTDAEHLGTAARELGATPARVHVVPWGVDPARFRPGAREPGLVLSTRMHEDVYDLGVIVEAAARVLAARADARLVIAGDGSRRASLERLAARRLPAGRFAFVGRLEPDALAAWLGRADVYVSASRTDSTSLSLL